MGSKKGFTLIELLAVIVILAVIALIATPIIMNVINDSKKGAAKDAMYGYVKAVELATAKVITATTDAPSGTYTTANGNLKKGSETITINFKGTKPKDDGEVILSKGNVTSATLEFDGVTVTYNGKEATIGGNSSTKSDITLLSGNAFQVGAKYQIKGTNQNSTWYVIASDTDTVTLFSEYNLSKQDNFKVQDQNEYTYTDDIESGTWASVNATAFDGTNDRHNAANTYCNTVVDSESERGCNIYAATSGTVVNGTISGTVTQDSAIKLIVDAYVDTLKLGGNLLEGRLITADELVTLGCSKENEQCPVDKYPWITSVSYWTQTPSTKNQVYLWTVISVPVQYSFSDVDTSANADDVWGVRPVIKLKKSAF